MRVQKAHTLVDLGNVNPAHMSGLLKDQSDSIQLRVVCLRRQDSVIHTDIHLFYLTPYVES